MPAAPRATIVAGSALALMMDCSVGRKKSDDLTNARLSFKFNHIRTYRPKKPFRFGFRMGIKVEPYGDEGADAVRVPGRQREFPIIPKN